MSEKFSKEELQTAAAQFTRPCNFVISVANLVQLPESDFDEVAFAGRSNVGKSSLINALFNQTKLAKTSSTPGRTQQLNFFNFDNKLYLVDLPGYGYAKAPEKLVKQWQVVLKTYLRGRPTLRRVFLLIDSRHGLKKEDREIMKLLDESAVTYQIVLTKIDKISEKALSAVSIAITEELKKHAAAMPETLATSSEKKIGLDILKAEVCSFMK
ncbi:MAG: ribosome biogenesis GTP-binding protein YihA/YsxC [Alphaproteobacteria bacterium]|nr:ribosome biogenesis GTP-binding protein YihA/YsxC [Alphaproteobacteria bacterium]MDY4689101.1 ribosome biogenesis GTP-binding protein YihA/YsxC [Alphaproteobacteria bacterium]